jgi:general secretion pathway protein K
MSAPGCVRAARGAALLLAMVILTLVATLAAGMVWQQERSVRVEAAERARAQAAWILGGALDWARLILREDQRADRERQRSGSARPPADALGETWAQPLAEARLSSFLAVDRDNSADVALEVFLSGEIVDAQARWNLRNLLGSDGKVVPAELDTLRRLVEQAGAPSDTADRLGTALAAAWAPTPESGAADVPIAPDRVDELRWLGIDAATIERLAPLLTVLPVRTPLNLNTASSPVLAAVIAGLDLGSAERIVQARKREDLVALRTLEQVKALVPQEVELSPERVALTTRFFEVRGRLRLEDRVLEERSLVERRDNELIVRRRERVNLLETR